MSNARHLADLLDTSGDVKSGHLSNLDLSLDTTPQLGGNLSLNNFNISGTGNVSATDIDVLGNFKLSGESMRVQRQRVQGQITGVTINSSSWTTIVDVSITVREGSSCLVMANADQNVNGTDGWQWVALFRGTSMIGTSTISVEQSGWNDNFHPHHWDDNLTAGTYTYALKAYNGANYMFWGEHSDPTIQVIEFAKT